MTLYCPPPAISLFCWARKGTADGHAGQVLRLQPPPLHTAVQTPPRGWEPEGSGGRMAGAGPTAARVRMTAPCTGDDVSQPEGRLHGKGAHLATGHRVPRQPRRRRLPGRLGRAFSGSRWGARGAGVPGTSGLRCERRPVPLRPPPASWFYRGAGATFPVTAARGHTAAADRRPAPATPRGSDTLGRRGFPEAVAGAR